MWILTAISLIGVVLNINKKKSCFICWIISNACWAVIDFSAGLPEQGVLFSVYFCLACWGLIAWRRDGV